MVMAKKKQQTGKRTLRRRPDDVGWPRVWVTTRDVVGHHPGSRRLLYSVTMITETHTETRRRRRRRRKNVVAFLAKPYEECCVCVKLGKEMIGEGRMKEKKLR